MRISITTDPHSTAHLDVAPAGDPGEFALSVFTPAEHLRVVLSAQQVQALVDQAARHDVVATAAAVAPF